LSRAERDARNTRLLLLGVGGALALVVLLVVFGVLRDAVFLPNEPVAVVGSETILTREFQQRVRLARANLRQQLEFFQQLNMQDNVQQVTQRLNDRQGLGSDIINQLIDESVYRQSAPELGVSVAADEVQVAIEEQFDYFRNPPTPAPTLTPEPTLTPSATITVTPESTATPFPTPTPVTAEGFQSLFQQQMSELGRYGIGEADYRRIVASELIADRIQEILSGRVVTMTEQAQFEYIAATTESNISTVKQAVDADGFDVVFSQVLSGTFTITNEVFASDTPFIPKQTLIDSSQFGQAFADLVFSAPISQTFGVISNTAGSAYYVGRVLDRGVRELDPSALQQAQSDALQDWLAERRAALGVQVLMWEDRVPGDP
jgi:hypothetical protein